MKQSLPLLAVAATLLAGCSLQPGVSGLTAAQGDAILAELKDIRQLLAEQRPQAAEPAAAPAAEAAAAKAPAAPAAAAATVRLDDLAPNVIGAADAPVSLVEFTDYQCPYCKRFHERSWPELKRKYVDTGKVRLVVRDLPLPFHGEALPAAIAARCAGEQGRFAVVHEGLISTPELSADAIGRIVAIAGVAAEPFAACIKGPAVRAAIDADTAVAGRLGVDGTPGFVVARRSGGELVGTLILGAQATAVFTARIDALLAAPAAP